MATSTRRGGLLPRVEALLLLLFLGMFVSGGFVTGCRDNSAHTASPVGYNSDETSQFAAGTSCPVGTPPTNAINAKTSFGATGSASNTTGSDTEAINKAITAAAAISGGGTVFIPDGTYMIRTDHLPPPHTSTVAPFGQAGIQMKSHVTLFLSANAVLKALPSNQQRYAVVVFPLGVSNATIKGGSIVGDLGVHTGSGGEWGMGILTQGASNVTIVGVNISKCWGDGIDLTFGSGNHLSSNVSICGVVVNNARRNGMSITGAFDVTVTDSTFQNAGKTVNGQAGTNPKAGLDVEPDTGSAHGITIKNCMFMNNLGSGLLFSDSIASASITGNSVSDCVMQGNAQWGLGVYRASHISASNNVIQSNVEHGVRLDDATSCSLTGNTLTTNGGSAVTLQDGSSGNTVTGNTCKGTGAALVISGSSGNTVSGNTGCVVH